MNNNINTLFQTLSETYHENTTFKIFTLSDNNMIFDGLTRIDSIFLNSSLERLTALFSNSFNEPFIVVHTGLVERKTYKTMSLDYWNNLLLELLNNFSQKIVIIGSKFEKKNIDSILTHVNAG